MGNALDETSVVIYHLYNTSIVLVRRITVVWFIFVLMSMHAFTTLSGTSFFICFSSGSHKVKAFCSSLLSDGISFPHLEVTELGFLKFGKYPTSVL